MFRAATATFSSRPINDGKGGYAVILDSLQYY